MTHTPADLAARAAASVDGGDMDCGSGLLLMLTRHMRALEPGQDLLVRSEEPSVPGDLRDWAGLAGHTVVGEVAESLTGPWHVLVRRMGGLPAAARDSEPPLAPAAPGLDADAAYSIGDATPLGSRVWLYSNFHCNLACSYCCAQSSPAADPRAMPVALADQVAAEFAAMGGAEVFVTGGEPFLHPQIGELITAVAARLPVTILTNAMVVDRGRRRAALEALPRQRVTLQISLDSVTPAIHDRNRGPGSHAKAMAGIGLARELGFAVRLAATMYPQDAAAATGLTALLDDWGIPADHRLIRPVAQQGFATAGEAVTVDTLAPEPTVAVDGVWWHPVGVTDPGMLVSPTPLPLRDALDTIADTVRVQDAARAEGRRHVFRCA